MSIRVVLADDQALVRTGFRMILAEAGDIAEAAGEAGDGEAAVKVAAQVIPDVALMDASDAWHGRDRRHPAHPRRAAGDQGADPHHVRPR